MNVIRLMGGLGNQLFQYAFGRAMMENGKEVLFDISNFTRKRKNRREFMLNKFNIDIQYDKVNDGVRRRRVLDIAICPSFNMNFLLMDNCEFFGYWQYFEYFKSILPKLQRDLWVRKSEYTEEFSEWRERITSSDSVSIHVRRDDYINNSNILCLPLSYYFEALAYTKGDLYIFSDDIDWCKDNFKEAYFNRKLNFVHLPCHLDFELMRLCKHNIIANSTFSWWAALLNENENKVVVTPNFWLGKGAFWNNKHNKNNLLEKWIKLDVNV